jgi:glutathione S-transferase
MLRLWGRENSSNVMKVVWLLETLGLEYERIDAGGSFGGTNTPAYRSMNPMGLVPTLEDGSFSLCESNAILRYLCNAHAPHSPLYPTAPQPRGTVDRWLDVQQTALGPAQNPLFTALVRTPPGERDRAAIDRLVIATGQIWSLLDAQIALGGFVAGEALSLADFSFGPHAHRWFWFPIERPPTPHLHAWYIRLCAMAPFARHIAAIPVS